MELCGYRLVDKHSDIGLTSTKLPAVSLFISHNLKSIFIYSTALFLLLVILLHGILYLSDRRDASALSRSLLDHAVTISKSVSKTIVFADSTVGEDLKRLKTGGKCSEYVLNKLRTALYRGEYIIDLGVVKDGHILCMVTAGNFPEPIPLIESQYRNVNGYYDVWRDIIDPIDPNIRYNAFGLGDIIALLSKSTFSFFDNLDSAYSARLESKKQDFVYRDLRIYARPESRIYQYLPKITDRSCDEVRDICVTLVNHRPGLMSFDFWGWIVTLVLCGMVSIGIIVTHHVFRWRYFSPKNFVRNSLSSGEINISYQPIVRIADGQLVGSEALLRISDKYGFMTTEKFVATAEVFGLTKALTISVIKKVISEFSGVLKMNPGTYVAINVPIADLLDCEILTLLDQVVKEQGLSADQVILEITERSATESQKIFESVREFKSHGYCFLLDDFGTGHSNFTRLTSLPVKGIKIDKSFIKLAGQKPFACSVMSKLLNMTKEMGLAVIVEGIETKRGADFVLSLNPEALGQGWFWGEARPIGEFIASYLGEGRFIAASNREYAPDVDDGNMTI